jgi:hypothetical protein
MKLLRSALILACVVFVAVPAFADITVKMTMTTSGGPVSMEASSASYIKGMKMRSDVKVMDQDMSMFVDVAAKQQLMVNNVTKEVQDVGAALASMPFTVGEATVSVKPNGQTKELLGRTCAGFAVEYSMPMTMMGETLSMTMSGVVWIAKDAPGAAEYQAFTKAAAAAGLMSGILAQGPQAKGISQLQAALTENGIPLEQDMQMTMAGTGQVGEMLAQSGAGNMRMLMKVTAISVDPIAADLMTWPAGAPKK